MGFYKVIIRNLLKLNLPRWINLALSDAIRFVKLSKTPLYLSQKRGDAGEKNSNVFSKACVFNKDKVFTVTAINRYFSSDRF